jgi:asparagine synthase (glutamine-hydrolysing)
MISAVRKLSPGSTLAVEAGAVGEHSWRQRGMAGDRRDRKALVEEYRAGFEKAVVRQMMSDRPIGVMLSGGVDSAAITAIMAEHSSQVRTFTMGFDAGRDTNELPLAERTAKLFGTKHEAIVVDTDDYCNNLPASLLMVEEPVGSTSALALHYVAKLMRPHVPVALCGQGADEPLAGYWRHLGLKLATRLTPLAPLGAGLGALPPLSHNVRIRRGIATLKRTDVLARLMAAYCVFDPAEKDRLYRSEFKAQLVGARPEAAVERFLTEVGELDPLAQMLYVDTRLWLPDELLLIADKMSMAASVELRVPFLDQDLVALIESMHSSQKLRGVSRKSIHKQAVRKWLPASVIHRRERGWATPLASWLRGRLRPLLEQVLLTPDGLCRSLFDERRLRSMVEEHASGAANRHRELFCLLSLGLWEQSFAGYSAAATATAQVS